MAPYSPCTCPRETDNKPQILKNPKFVTVKRTKMKKTMLFLRGACLLLLLASCTSEDHLAPKEFSEKLKAENAFLLDVRTPEEFAEGHIEGAVNMDVQSADFNTQVSALDKNKAYYVYCRSGRRSASAQEIMKEAGFKQVYNLEGGILAWEKEGLPVTRAK